MQLNLMQHRITIQRRTPTQEGLIVSAGEDDPETVARRVPCLIQEKPGEVRPYPTGDRLRYDAICFLLVGTDIKPQKPDDQSDTVVIESHSTIPVGSKFLVLHVANPGGVSSLAAQHLEAYLRTN